MKSGKFYIVILNCLERISDLISEEEVNPNSVIEKGELQAIEFANFADANEVYQKIIHLTGINNLSSNYWNFVLLNEIGFKEFIELRGSQKFSLQSLRRKENEEIDLKKLEIQVKEPFGGGVIKGKRSDFESAFNFWVNSVTKITKEQFEINADLYGGTYNPITLNTLEKLVSNSCGRLNQYLNKEKFVSAIEMQNNSQKSGCYFVETEDEYFLIDLQCP